MVGAGMLGVPGQHPSPPHPHVSSSPTAPWVWGLGPELEDIQGRGAHGQRPGFAEVHMEHTHGAVGSCGRKGGHWVEGGGRPFTEIRES